MTKITLAVCKVFKNSGSLRSHRKKTKKHWKHYFLETENWKFGTEWVNSTKAQFLKLRKHHRIKYICLECLHVFIGYARNKKEAVDCPYCDS